MQKLAVGLKWQGTQILAFHKLIWQLLKKTPKGVTNKVCKVYSVLLPVNGYVADT